MFIGLLRASLDHFELWTPCNGSGTGNRSQINALFWLCLGFQLVFHYFANILQVFLKASRIEHYKWKQTIRSIWNIGFYGVALIFLHIYRRTFLATSLFFTESTGYGNQRIYENQLLHMANKNCSIFYWLTIILIAFHSNTLLHNLNDRSFAEAAYHFLYCCILACFNIFRLENYSITFNMMLCTYNIVTECLRIICWYIPTKNEVTFRVCMSIKILYWSYVFLSSLPFNFLIPTLYAKKFHLWLNIYLWFWYGASVWNSPILRYFYHQIYHVTNTNECIGENSITRCILIKNSREIRHVRNLQKAMIDLNLDGKKEISKTDCSSTKAYQTIKCMIALKRKLRRIRENKENAKS